MVRTVSACLIQSIVETGSCPTPQELYDVARPQYQRKVDFTRPGRGADEFREKMRIHGAGGSQRARSVESRRWIKLLRSIRPRARANQQPALPPPAKQSTAIKTVFLTLANPRMCSRSRIISNRALPARAALCSLPGRQKLRSRSCCRERPWPPQRGAFLVFKCVHPLCVFWLQAEMNHKLHRSIYKYIPPAPYGPRGIYSISGAR
jgi:hypothetical protein